MISSVPLFPPVPAYLTGAENAQPDGTITIIANDDTGAVFSVTVPTGALTQKPAGTATSTEKFTKNPGGGTVSAYIMGMEYCYKYDGNAV